MYNSLSSTKDTMKCFTLFGIALVLSVSDAAVVCPAGFVGQVIRGCTDAGMKCDCAADGSVACVDLCPPAAVPPYISCFKQYPPPERQNLDTGEGCCSEWMCPWKVNACAGNYTGSVVQNCRFAPMKCWCEAGITTGCLPMCIVRPDFDLAYCHYEPVSGPEDTVEGCCPKQVCNWDATEDDGGLTL